MPPVHPLEPPVSGAGNIYAYSSRVFSVDGHPLPYVWNHSIIYDDERYGQMPYLVQQLTARHINVDFDDSTDQLTYQLTASIDKGLVRLLLLTL